MYTYMCIYIYIYISADPLSVKRVGYPYATLRQHIDISISMSISQYITISIYQYITISIYQYINTILLIKKYRAKNYRYT